MATTASSDEFVKQLKHQVAIDTGGGRGLGREFAIALAKAGAAVAFFLNIWRTDKIRSVGIELSWCAKGGLDKGWAAFAIQESRAKEHIAGAIGVFNRKGVFNGRMEPVHKQIDTGSNSARASQRHPGTHRSLRLETGSG